MPESVVQPGDTSARSTPSPSSSNSSGGARLTRRRLAVVTLAYAAVTLILVAPFVNFAHLASSIYQGDARLILWTLAWDSHAMLNGLPLFQANVFYPAPDALAYNEHLIGIALFYLPLYVVSRNPVLAYNVLWLAAWLLNALAGFALARRYVRDDLAAFVGGLVYTFSFYRMLHGHGHLGLAWTFWIPLSILAMERWYERPDWKRAAWLTFTVVMQVLANWYLAVFVLVANTLFLGCLVAFHRRKAGNAPADSPRNLAARRVAHLAAAIVVLTLVVRPFAAHYSYLPPADQHELLLGSAGAVAYLVPPQDTWVGQQLVKAGFRSPRWIWGETTLFLGFVALALTLAGLVALAKRRNSALPEFPLYAKVFVVLVGATALTLSLGPSHGGRPFMPFDWFHRLPGLGGFRVPARFTLLVLLSMSVLTAAGVAWLHHRFPARGRVVTLLLIPLMLSEWYAVGRPAGTPPVDPIPSVYRYLAKLPARGVVSLPMAGRDNWWLEADYLYYSTAHWHPIVNGFGRSEPKDHFWIAGHMAAFAGPNSAKTMRRLGIDYVVLHAARLPDGPRMLEEALVSGANFRPVAHYDNDYLFKVVQQDANGNPLPR